MNTSKALVNGQKQLLGIVRGMMGTMNLAAMAADGLQHAMEAIDRKAGDRMQRSMENVERAIVSVAAPLEDIGDKLKALASSIDAADKRMASFMGMGAGVSVSTKMPLATQRSGPASVGAIDQASAASDRAELEAKIKQKVIPTLLKSVDTMASLLPKPKPGKPTTEIIRTTNKQLSAAGSVGYHASQAESMMSSDSLKLGRLSATAGMPSSSNLPVVYDQSQNLPVVYGQSPNLPVVYNQSPTMPMQGSLQLGMLERSQESSMASHESMSAAAAVALSSSEVQTELVRTIDPPEPALPNMNELLTGMRENLNVLLTENEAAASFMADNWSVVGSIYEGVNTGLQIFNALQLLSRGYTLLSTFAIHAKTAATIGLRNAWATLNATMKANVIILIISLIAGLITALIALWKNNDQFAIFFNKVWTGIKTFFAYLPYYFWTVVEAMLNPFMLWAKTIGKIYDAVINYIIDEINGLLKIFNWIAGTDYEIKFRSNFEELGEQAKLLVQDQKEKALSNAEKKAADYLDQQAEFERSRLAREEAEAEASELEKIESIVPSEDLLEQDTQVTLGGGRIDEVGKVKDTVDISSEDLKTMRELAEMKNIQNFVTLQPSVNVQTGDIRNGMDVSSMVQAITTVLQEEIATSAQGVYE